ncbi:TylF/MycF family methyltransferase [Burkholderia sp. JSH-S8]|uniref:TylF/MycF/NovP-related O-methyltransferase n=1 Tax=Burkholderia stagnalis TaxID=1503054 RepID=UPI0013DE7A5B|nr:TylF/MycF/NovP-related O-methyltransferase [Burkholderia stagnalis]WGS44508.1 TylF/MycF family methyltransferase [Burkholderia sp. JSH-S8]
MIELPKFSEQSMYDAETHFSMQMTQDRLAKFVVHYEAMKTVERVPGAIVECGVFKGTSLLRFAKLRSLLGGEFSRKIVAFDVFGDAFPTTAYEEDLAQREHWIATAGGSSISIAQLESILERFSIRNIELIAGDVCETVPRYADMHKGMKIALLNIDIDFVEPTYTALRHFYPMVSEGGLILLDNYGGEGTSGLSYHGDTAGIEKFVAECQDELTIEQFPFAARPCIIRKRARH